MQNVESSKAHRSGKAAPKKEQLYNNKVLLNAWEARKRKAAEMGAALDMHSREHRKNLPFDSQTFQRVLERGVNTSIKTLKAICSYLNVDPRDIL